MPLFEKSKGKGSCKLKLFTVLLTSVGDICVYGGHLFSICVYI